MNETTYRTISMKLLSAIGCPAYLLILLGAGCSLPLPEAQNDPTRTYVLSVPMATPAPDAAVIRLRPVELASYLNSRPMVVRRGENEIEFRDFALWGEPLEQGIARVLREALLASGTASAVQVSGSRSAGYSDDALELSVRVLACEGAADGNVIFHAVWTVATVAGGRTSAKRGEYHASDLRWDVANEATLAAALSRAVAGLAGEIAAGIRKS